MKKLEAQLQEVKQQTSTAQAKMKLLIAVEKMKRSQEQHVVQQQVIAI
jgi:hypothetical protein